MIRVVMLLEDLEYGGTQRQALELAAGLDRNRFAVELWLMRAGYDLLPLAERAGIPVACLSGTAQVGPKSLIELWRRLKSHPPDILVLLTVIPNIWGRLPGRHAKVPVILATCRGGASPARQHEKWLWPLSDHLVCNTSALRNALVHVCGLPESRVTLIRNGVDTGFFRPPETRRDRPGKNVLCIARFVPDKDHETLIEAFGIAARSHPDLTLLLVGDGKLRPRLERLASHAAPPGRIRFFPGQKDPRPFFHESDLFVLSSQREAMPNVVLEAMASGLPVVATSTGGLPEVVEHGRTGLLVPVRDAPGLARAIEALACDEKMCVRFGNAGRERAETDYSVAAMVQGHEELFGHLLDRRLGSRKRS
ncbi:MAG: glycosyltransferase [Desulfobacteraceae bacterium]|nr:glycosyltransferase [Desulfobacteraceae bacterium]